MKPSILGGIALVFALFGAGCMRMVDEPEEEGAAGGKCFFDDS